MRFLSERGTSSEDIQEHPDRVGGRYTFFSNIGMLAAGLAGIDIDALLGEARKAMESDIKYKLGQFMTDMEEQGRIYMRVILPEKLAKLGPWIEQLVAESLGKHDALGNERGIIAISERDFDPSIYANEDVFAVRIKLGEMDERDGFTKSVIDNGTPLFEFQVSSIEEVGGVMYALEWATGQSGISMGIDPFDQPGVEAKKQITRDMKTALKEAIEARITSDMSEDEISEITKGEFLKVLASYQTEYRVEIAEGVTLDFGDFVKVLKEQHGIDFETEMAKRELDITKAEDVYQAILILSKEEGKTYSAILPYDETFKDHSAWAQARALMRSRGLNDVFGIGPVYEHSYSQFFDQGPNKGLLMPVVSLYTGDIKIPGDSVPGITFAMQNALQAFGAMAAEVNNDIPRLAVRIEIDGKITSDVMLTLEAFFASLHP
jgi:hypothetical protein